MTKYYLPFIIVLLAVIAFLLFKGCEPTPHKALPKLINTDSIKAELKKELEEAAILHSLSEQAQDSAIKYVDRWHKAKHDTIPCEEKLPVIIQVCDTAIDRLQAANKALVNENEQQQKVIKTQSNIIRSDSTNTETYKDSIKVLVKENKKLRRQKTLWQVLFGVSTAANVAQSVRP